MEGHDNELYRMAGFGLTVNEITLITISRNFDQAERSSRI